MEIKNGVTKYDLYEILNSSSELAEHLPPAQMVCDFNDILEFIERFEKVVLKQITSYNEERVFIIERQENNFKITDYTKKKSSKLTLENTEELQDFFQRNKSYLQNCVIQRYIKPAKIEETTFDMRIIMKKATEGKWNMNGVECRVGGNNFLFTNVYKYDFYLPLNEVIKKYYPLHFSLSKKITEINELCIKACNIIDDFIDGAQKISFDTAIDEETKVWFMEIRMLENLKKFFVADYNTYLSIKYIPLLYNISSYNSKSR